MDMGMGMGMGMGTGTGTGTGLRIQMLMLELMQAMATGRVLGWPWWSPSCRSCCAPTPTGSSRLRWPTPCAGTWACSP